MFLTFPPSHLVNLRLSPFEHIIGIPFLKEIELILLARQLFNRMDCEQNIDFEPDYVVNNSFEEWWDCP